MHTFFQRAVFNKHAIAMLKALRGLGIRVNIIYEYLKKWQWPGHVHNKTGVSAFSPKRLKASFKANTLKIQASEGRSLCPVLAKFARGALLPHTNEQVRAHGECFILLADLVALVEGTKRY